MTDRDRTVQCLQDLTEARVHTRAALLILEEATGPLEAVRASQSILDLHLPATQPQDPGTPPVASQGRRRQ